MKISVLRTCLVCQYGDRKRGRVSEIQLNYLKSNPVNKNYQCPNCRSWGMLVEVVKEKPDAKDNYEQDFIPGRENLNRIWKFK